MPSRGATYPWFEGPTVLEERYSPLSLAGRPMSTDIGFFSSRSGCIEAQSAGHDLLG